MDIVRGLEVFVAVAEHDGMAPAARALDMSTSAVSRHLKDLEDWTGRQFFRRTTRSISLTEAGVEHLEQARRVLEGVRGFRDIAPEVRQDRLVGTIRLTAPEFVLKRMMVDALAAFQQTHPAIILEILATERIVDLVAEGFDVAIRVGTLADSTLKARKLTDVRLQLVASEEYIRKHGAPGTVADLKDHQCLLDSAPHYKARWPLTDASAKRGVTVSGSFGANSGELVEEYALRGLGIGLLPEILVADHLREKRLVSLLNDAGRPTFGVYVVHPDMRIVQPKVRAFVDFIAACDFD